MLGRNLHERPPMSDLFTDRGRCWLGALDLTDEEVETMSAAPRQIDFFTAEIETIERELARFGTNSAEVRRLMTVPGVAMVSATTFLAQVGEIGRFASPKHLVGYLGLYPRVRQSGESAARMGADLQGGFGTRAACDGGGGNRGDQDARATARLLSAPSSEEGSSDRDRRDRSQDRRDRSQDGDDLLAPTKPRRGLPPPARAADKEEAPQDGAEGRGEAAARGRRKESRFYARAAASRRDLRARAG